MRQNSRFGFWGAVLWLFIGSGVTPAVAGNPVLIPPEKLSQPVAPAVKVTPVQVREKYDKAKARTPVGKPSVEGSRQVIKTPVNPLQKAPVVPAAPAIRPTGRSMVPAPLSLPKSKRFGRNKPVTGPAGKSLLPTPLPATAQPIRGRGGFAPPLRPGSAVPGIKQMRTDPRHLLEGGAPATLGGRGVSASVTETIQADLVIEDISLDASRRAVLVKWREAQHHPLPAGSFDWAVGLVKHIWLRATACTRPGTACSDCPGLTGADIRLIIQRFPCMVRVMSRMLSR